MINICFFSGKVINNPDLKFVYNKEKKNLDKKHKSVIQVKLELINKQIINLQAYNDVADIIYRNIKQNNLILTQCKLRSNYIEIEEILLLKT